MAESNVLGPIQDSNVTKYTAHKNWNLTSQSFNQSGYSALRGIYPGNTVIAISSSTAVNELKNVDGSYMKNVYYEADHLFYKFYPRYGYINYDIGGFTRILNHDLIAYSIPRIKVGDKIKPSSVTLTVIDPDNNSIPLTDNGRYELIDTRINTSSFVNQTPLVYLGFNDGFDINRKSTYFEKDITYVLGISSSKFTYGYQALFNGTSSSAIVNSSNANDNWLHEFDGDFSISFWAKPITSGGPLVDQRAIISKKWLDDFGYSTLSDAYPFHINYNESAQAFEFTRSDGINLKTISIDSPIDTQAHIVFQKTGSTLEGYLNGSLFVTDTDTIVNSVSNFSRIHIGCTSNHYYDMSYATDPYIGYLDEIRVYNKALSLANITSLSTLTDTDYLALQTNKVGNVFYEHGIVIYSPYQNEFATGSYGIKNFTISYRSSLDIEQYKYYVNVPMDKYNWSTNPSLYDSTGSLSVIATSSDFHPYITTIGLYDKDYELVAIAKLGAPIPKRNDIDLNFEIRFDRS